MGLPTERPQARWGNPIKRSAWEKKKEGKKKPQEVKKGDKGRFKQEKASLRSDPILPPKKSQMGPGLLSSTGISI